MAVLGCISSLSRRSALSARSSALPAASTKSSLPLQDHPARGTLQAAGGDVLAPRSVLRCLMPFEAVFMPFYCLFEAFLEFKELQGMPRSQSRGSWPIC